MGQQSQQQSQQPTENLQAVDWDRRARGGCDLDQVTEDIRREFGPSGIEEVRRQIYYLSAHGGYSQGGSMTRLPEGLTVIHLTAFSSSVNIQVMRDFAELPTEIKIAMLRYSNCADVILQSLEESYSSRMMALKAERDQLGIEDTSFNPKYPEDKGWGDDDQLNLVMYQNEMPDIELNFIGEGSSLAEIQKTGQSSYFLSGLTHQENDINYTISNLQDRIGSISTSDKRARKIIKDLLYKTQENKPLVNFFLNRLNKFNTLYEVMSIKLSDLVSNRLLPRNGFLFMSACRVCMGRHPSSSKIYVGDITGGELYEKDLKSLSTDSLVNTSLEQSCSEISCSERLRSFDPRAVYYDQNTVCKISGYNCSVCDTDGSCISCIDSNSVVILPDGNMDSKCIMCFTMEEILDMCNVIPEIYEHTQHDPNNYQLTIRNLPNIFLANPIYPLDCKFDSRIIKFCLALVGNPNQNIFSTIRFESEYIRMLYIILCFRYIDFSVYLQHFMSIVSTINLGQNFLRVNHKAQFFVDDLITFTELDGDIDQFMRQTIQHYEVAIQDFDNKSQRVEEKRKRRKTPYNRQRTR